MTLRPLRPRGRVRGDSLDDFYASRIWLNGRVVLLTGSGGFSVSVLWRGEYTRFALWGIRWHLSRGDIP